MMLIRRQIHYKCLLFLWMKTSFIGKNMYRNNPFEFSNIVEILPKCLFMFLQTHDASRKYVKFGKESFVKHVQSRILVLLSIQGLNPGSCSFVRLVR